MEEINNQIYLSISEINDIIHDLFANIPQFHKIYLKGEITNYRGPNRSGHHYLALKDENSLINAVIFKYDYYSIKEEFKNGDEVLICGEISSYKVNGTYQVIIHSLTQYGKGINLLKREQLKNKLLKEGLFNEEHKLPIPLYPIKIAIVTGKNSAAIEDFRFNLVRRWPIGQYKFYTCLVQGEKAPEDIIRTLKEVILDKPELIILGRGGGASDDLTPFDNEDLVRFIYNLNIPLISAIGHEINSTFVDYVSDKHASTPTGACEIAVPNYLDVLNDLHQIENNLHDKIVRIIQNKQIKLNSLKDLKVFQDISNIFLERQILLNNYRIEMEQKISHLINLKQTNLENINKNIKEKLLNLINHNHLKLLNYDKIIETLNPNEIFKKGYSVLKDLNNNTIKSINDLTINQEINIYLKEGKAKAVVKEVSPYGK